MRQYGLLAGVFGVTLAVLLVGFLVIEQLGSGGAVAVASPSPSLTIPTQRITPRPVPTTQPSAPLPPSVSPRPTPPPDTPPPATSPPKGTPKPTPKPVAPGTVVEIVVPGSGYVYEEIPINGTVTKVGNGVLMKTTRDYSEHMTLTYKLPVNQLSSGTRIVNVDVAVCGKGEGDFWETYGPAGAEPYEHEVTLPGPDGCWHYTGGSISDTATFAIIRGETTFKIDKVVYTITTG